MQVLPVLDLLGGVVVRGVAGRRDEYRPIQSALATGSDALTVANAFRENFGLTELYVADLDAIVERQPNWAVYHELASAGFRIMLDAGLADIEVAQTAIDAGVATIVAALETSPGAAHLQSLCEKFGADRVVFSLDLKAGQPVGRLGESENSDPLEIAQSAVAAGITRMIVLDLAGVGVGQGVPTGPLCRQLLQLYPELQLITGGGVRSVNDACELKQLGVWGVLIASALHDGSFTREDLRNLHES